MSQYLCEPHFHAVVIEDMRSTKSRWLIWAGSIFKTVHHKDVSDLARFHAFIQKKNNSTIFWSLAAGLMEGNVALRLDRIEHRLDSMEQLVG